MPIRYSLIQPDVDRLELLRSTSEREAVTYDPVGASVTGDRPVGYHWHESELTAEVDWTEAKEAIRSWSGHRSAGAVLTPGIPPLVEGITMAFGIRVLGVWATGACRIVRIIDDERNFGFSYGTLPHHPESGEELFAVRDNGDGTVTFRVAAFSRPAGLLTTIIGPMGRFIQGMMTTRYLDGFADFASSVATDRR